MPSTRKKVIKTVYKDEDSEGETGDFSDSGSEAHISEPPSSDEEEIEEQISSADEFSSKQRNKAPQKNPIKRKPKFAKEFIDKINKQTYPESEENDDIILKQFSVKDLTDADKLLPSVLNLSESDSSDDETPKTSSKKAAPFPYSVPEENDSEIEDNEKYTDIWANNIPNDSEEVAKKTFMELEKHKNTLEETKASLQSYVPRSSTELIRESNVTDLLALGEDAIPQKIPVKTKIKGKKTKNASDSEVEDWEEVKESKAVPQQGLQLLVALPDYVCRKSKKIDVEMMMKRKMNRVKKEHQVFMHKVHVLSWIGHGNYVSLVLNDQEIMATVLALVPKGCYPESRLDMKYVEQIAKWYKDKINIKQDKYENKFRPKAPPLRNILLEQIKSRSVSAKKYMVFIFVAMLRALGLQSRIMFNFVTVPLRPPISELCSLSTKPKEESKTGDNKVEKSKAAKAKSTETKAKSKVKIPQVDGNYDRCSSLDDDYYGSDSECENSNDLEKFMDENDDTNYNELEEMLNEIEDRSYNELENSNDLEKFMDENDDTNYNELEEMLNEIEDRSYNELENSNDLEKFMDENDDTNYNELEEMLNEIEDRSYNELENSNDLEKFMDENDDTNYNELEEMLNEIEDRSYNELENLSHEDNNTNYKEIENLSEMDENYGENDSDFENIMQLDGNDDAPATKARPMRTTRAKKAEAAKAINAKKDEEVSPPKRFKKNPDVPVKAASIIKKVETSMSPQSKNTIESKRDDAKSNAQSKDFPHTAKSPRTLSLKKPAVNDKTSDNIEKHKLPELKASPRKTRSNRRNITQANDSTTSIKTDKANPTESQVKIKNNKTTTSETQTKNQSNPPKIVVYDENKKEITQSKYFDPVKENTKRSTRKRSHTTIVDKGSQKSELKRKDSRAKSAPGSAIEKSKYFEESESTTKKPKLNFGRLKKQEKIEDAQRVSHKDLIKSKSMPKNDVTGDLVNIIKGRIRGAKEEAKKGIVKGKLKEESGDDSDCLPVEDPIRRISSDEEFKPTKISPRGPKLGPEVKPSTSKKRIDRRVLSSDDEALRSKYKVNVWCEIFVEELEQWIAVDVVNGKVHCSGDLYRNASHPVCYVIGWDNNNYLKDLTRRYVPHWNTVTRKQRVEPEWWRTAVEPWLGPRNARDREEDEALDRMQLEAPLPTSIGEYKNHPLYALKRHLLKFEALYPPDAQTLGFVRNEPVYARECVYVCRSRDIWLKEAKVVKMGEKPYKIVKARPKWDKLSNKMITDKPLEVFGPWQVQDYEPPTAQNGIVPRNAYGNVELFKECMLPKGTVNIKLPGLNKVCRKLNIDCAPAMTGFDYTGGYAHPAYDGFVVCKEFEEIVTAAWLKDQEEQERKEIEKLELRVYGNWKRLIKGLLIRERLKYKYGFGEPSTSKPTKKKGPRLVVKKN